eukprot:TRINITY_DN10435_c0_g1_i5.p4 TRINITY_DN10435_c0_g1~~TRINITY_DN10435_c0_g1_i5.p4  ORF type:complete len:105 (-),score=6.47 TRINITY_DN10435_c0_g1_i5:108-422(-)
MLSWQVASRRWYDASSVSECYCDDAALLSLASDGTRSDLYQLMVRSLALGFCIRSPQMDLIQVPLSSLPELHTASSHLLRQVYFDFAKKPVEPCFGLSPQLAAA